MKKVTQKIKSLIINHLQKTSKISDKYINKNLEISGNLRIFII
jgi:hypothetical protein